MLWHRAGDRKRMLWPLMVALLIAAGCGDADDAAEDATAADEAVEDEAPPEPRQGGDLVAGTIFDAFGLDPTTFVGGVVDAHIALALYDPLMMQTPDAEVEPFLAESLETDDSQTWTLRVREGVEFHDGTTLDAEAVKVNLDHHRDPETGSRALVQADNIEEITVVDRLTAEIELQFPWPAFPEVLAGNLGLMASPAAIEDGSIAGEPVGTGPFLLEDWERGERMTLVRNENYWREDEPYLDRIIFRVILDDAIRRASVETGEIDVAQTIRGDTLVQAEAAEGTKTTQSQRHPNTIHINTEVEPMDDVRVRRALALALDTDALNQTIFEGTARTNHRFIDDDSPFLHSDLEVPEYHPEEAQRLIDEVEAERGPVSFTFRCYNEPSRQQLTQLAEQMWSQVGFDVDVEMSDQITMVLDVFEGNYTAACFSMGVETQDPDLIFHNAFHSESQSNYMGYANPQMDEALTTGRTNPDPEVRAEAYRTVQELLVEDLPVIEYASGPWGWVMRDEVFGLEALPGVEFRPALVFLGD
jgi:peptide/nickel transport system substrate-binding protein